MATEVPLETKSGPNVQKILPTMLGRQLNVRCTTSTTTDRSPPVFGRIIQSVRDTHEWFESVTDMEPCPTTTTYKPPGTSCSMGRNEIILMTNMQQTVTIMSDNTTTVAYI